MNDWRSIDHCPRDGTHWLFLFDDVNGLQGHIEGWWFSSPKQIDDGWETIIGFIGEPAYFQALPPPPNGTPKPDS